MMRSDKINKTNIAGIFRNCTNVDDKCFKAIIQVANEEYCIVRAMEEIEYAKQFPDQRKEFLNKAITLLGMAVIYGIQTENKREARGEDPKGTDQLP